MNNSTATARIDTTNETSSETNEDRIRRQIARAKDDLSLRELRETGLLENAVVDDEVIASLKDAHSTIAEMMVKLQDLIGFSDYRGGGPEIDNVDLESLARLARGARLAVIGAFENFRGHQAEAARKENIARLERKVEDQAAAAPKDARSKRAKKSATREARS